MSEPQRVLVRLPNWLGDLLLARPLLHALAAQLPRAELRAVGPAPLIALLAPEATRWRLEPWPPARAGRDRLVQVLRTWRPDAAVVLPPSFSSALFAWRVGARRRIGYAHEGRSLLLTDAPRRPQRGERHLSCEYLDLARPLGVAEASAPPLAVAAEARARALELLERDGSRPLRYAVMAPGARYGPAKRWPAESFAALGRALRAEGLEILLCGGVDEAELCATLARALGAGARSLAGQSDLPVQAALCAGAALTVSNDSGLAHLAAAVGCPTVVVFGSTCPAWTAPIGARVRVACRPPVCSPCFRRTCAVGYRCLLAVEPAHVLARAREVWAA
jgi:heptosyltransferase-2